MKKKTEKKKKLRLDIKRLGKCFGRKFDCINECRLNKV